MDIILIYKEDYPWDVRVEKISNSLCEAGHSVTIVANNNNENEETEEFDGLTIMRLPQRSIRLPLIRKLLNFPFWFNPFWSKTLVKAVSNSDCPIIIVRDLPLARTAIRVGQKMNAKVILDMAEVYPYMYASGRQFAGKFSFGNLIKSPKLAERYESSVLPVLDHTLVMIEESRDRLLSKGISNEKVTIVSNTPPIDKFGNNVHEHRGDTLRIVYVGFLTKLRGLDLLIKATSEYIRSGNPPESIKIDIVGKGAERDSLINLVSDLGLQHSVTVHGWLDHVEVNQLMAQANVGALTYRVCPHWNHTIPNKIFDYMLAGLPVLATEVTPIKRILDKTGAGLVCRDLDIQDIAKKLELLRSPETRTKLGSNGNRAILSEYNWPADERRLHAVIDSLSDKEI